MMTIKIFTHSRQQCLSLEGSFINRDSTVSGESFTFHFPAESDESERSESDEGHGTAMKMLPLISQMIYLFDFIFNDFLHATFGTEER